MSERTAEEQQAIDFDALLVERWLDYHADPDWLYDAGDGVVYRATDAYDAWLRLRDIAQFGQNPSELTGSARWWPTKEDR